MVRRVVVLLIMMLLMRVVVLLLLLGAQQGSCGAPRAQECKVGHLTSQPITASSEENQIRSLQSVGGRGANKQLPHK